jgi:elongation factor P hydroxylase
MRLIGICDDCLQITNNLPLSEYRSVLVVEDVEPIYIPRKFERSPDNSIYDTHKIGPAGGQRCGGIRG